MNDFRKYFDMPVQYSSADFPVDARFELSNGSQFKPDTLIGNYTSGTSVSYSFMPNMQVNGQNYVFVKSFVTTQEDPSTHLSGYDTTNTKQTIKTSVSGNYIVGVYQMGPPQPINTPQPSVPAGSSMSGQDLDPSPTAVVKADQRDAEQFDVSLGIPTTENLYANALTKDHLYKYQFTQKTGQKTYTVNVTKTYNLSWQVQSGTDSSGNPTYTTQTDSETITQPVTVYRNYSYWIIGELEVYGIRQADVVNDALPGGHVTLMPGGGYSPPSVGTWHSDSESDHIIEPAHPDVNLGSESLSSSSTSPPAIPNESSTFAAAADNSVQKIKVRDDQLLYNGSTLMNDQWVDETGPTPSAVPSATQVNRNVLYQSGLTIPEKHVNELNDPSSGTISYFLVKGINGGDANRPPDPIPGVNSVTVHSPVVDYSTVSDDKAHNQKTVPDPSKDALILGRPFTITMPTNGQHRSIKGYGNRDYAKYTAHKQVQFDFDVYNEADGKAIQAGQWIEVPVTQLTMTFYLPVWVHEGTHHVYFREIANNSPNQGFGTQTNANLDLSNYAATEDIPVDVIGRVYDFHITDIADYNWQNVFRQADGTTPTGVSYWVGDKDIDGNPRGNSFPYMLPVGEGSNPNPGYKNVAVKTGYHFKFDLKTIGDMYGPNDGIRITPSFYFVDKNGSSQKPIPVDLYYHTQTNAFVKIGSSQDQEKRYVVLNDPLRNVPQQELVDTSNYLYDHGASGGSTRSDFYNNYLLAVQSKTWVGNYSLMILTAPLRTFIGNKSNLPSWVGPEQANASVQKWYGEYSIPAAPYVVPAGTDLASYAQTHTLDDHSPIFLHNGYIVVKFNIETIQNQDVAHPHLQYMNGPLDNQWKMEGFRYTFTDPYNHSFALEDGDVMMYDAEHSSQDDFGSGQTH